MVLSQPSPNAAVLTRRWKQLIRCNLLLLLLRILPISLCWSHCRCAVPGHARPAAAQGCVLIPGTAPERVLLARESSGLSCWAKIRGAAPFCVSYPANPLCVTLSFKAAPLTQNCCGGLWVFLLFVRKGRWFLNDTQLERCLGTGHQSSQLFGSLACRETDGSQESKWLLTT